MGKYVVLLLLLLLTGCVNNQWAVPDQKVEESKDDDRIVVIQYTF
jgi:hypothetical protein